jgi:dihydropteroate synthase
MGVLNVTPDSFSDGGRNLAVETAVASAERMIAEGADIIDIGGESTRPDADPVDGETERTRVLPVIEALAGRDVAISIDTYRAETADAAVRAGAHVVNDVWGAQRDPDLARVAAKTGAGLILMHNSRDRNLDADPVVDQKVFLERSLKIAADAGVVSEAIVLDPGIGFGKDATINLALMARLEELHALGHPLLLGTSRKRFLGAITGHDRAANRDAATAATTALGRAAGVAIFRVHAVEPNRDAVAVADAVRRGEVG